MSVDNTKIIDRIRKLLKLAQDAGATDGERENAVRMAHATLAKYNIDMADVDMAGSVEKRVEIYFDEKKNPCYMVIVNSIAKLFFCKVYYTPCPVGVGIHISDRKVRYYFVGRESNTLTAMLMSEWIIKTLRNEKRRLGVGNSFLNGASHKVASRVNQIIGNSATNTEFSNSTALAVVSLYKTEAQANDEFLADRNLKLKKMRDSKVDSEQYKAGSEYGEKINLNQQVSGTKQAAIAN